MTQKSVFTRPACYLALFVMLFITLKAAHSQEISQYDRGTPPQHMAGVGSFGSYTSADIGVVNLSNGALNFNLPIGSVGGRGFQIPITLSYSSKVWSVGKGNDVYSGVEFDVYERTGGPQGASVAYAQYAAADFRLDYYNRVAPGWTIGAQPLLKKDYMGLKASAATTCGAPYSLTKLTLILPDKSEVSFRDDQTDGAPLPSVDEGNGCYTLDGNRGTRWHSVDGSNMVFISSQVNGVVAGNLSGEVITADGTRYHFTNISGGGVARCDLITDRNGNQIKIEYPADVDVKYTDQLGRVTTVDGIGTSVVTVTLPGYGGPHQYKIKLGVMNQHYRAGISPQMPVINGDYTSQKDGATDRSYPGAHTSLFPMSYGTNVETIDDKEVVSQVVLPDGRSLNFAYNEFGEVAEVWLPSGGKVEYDYAYRGALPSGNSLSWETRTTTLESNVREVDRALIARRTYPDGATLESSWSYTYGPKPVNGTSHPCADVQAQSADGAILLHERHFFMTASRYIDHNRKVDGTGYMLWSTGLEWRTEVLDTAGGVIKASEEDWSQRAALSWSTGFAQEQPENDNRVNEARQILDAGLTAKTTTDYDQYNNPIEVAEHDFDGSLKRRSVTTYANSNSSNQINGLDYTSDTIHLLRLPLSKKVYDGAATSTDPPSAQTVYQYDKYTDDGNNLPLANYAEVSGHDLAYGPAKSTRGNLTRTGSWLQTPGVTATSYIYTHSRYDILGNVVSIKDARQNVSTISYEDNFGDGNDLEMHDYTPLTPTYALPTLITSPPPNLGEPAHTASSQYDYNTGLLTGFRDRNGVVTQTVYQDAFDRPTLIKTALGEDGFESHARMYYAPATAYGLTLAGNDVLTVKDRAVLNDAQLRSWTRTDGFGRTTASWSRDPQGDVTVSTVYDGLGRASQMSNPYRPSQDEQAQYTTTSYDLAGRVKSVKTPDGAEVVTAYSGNTTGTLGTTVTVTDQAQKKRKSLTDALGRLVQVTEDPGALNYQTSYSYDALGNLRTVTQGTVAQEQQTRNFLYDSLSRLTSATHPESGTTNYSYDAAGNLKTKTQVGRNSITNYEYDALNRLKKGWYTGSVATPTVVYTYDASGVVHSTGRLTSVSSSVSTTNYTAYDALGRVAASSQVTDGVTYLMPAYKYDFAGNLMSETYPSGRVMTYSYDTAGRLSKVEGQKTGELNKKPYASTINYTPHGAVAGMKLGNDLWEHTSFNARLQPTEIGLGTSQNGVERLKLKYDYGTTDNNGNLLGQIITVPDITKDGVTIAGHTATQNYTYDKLNRLETAKETVGTTTTQTWRQVYAYDRFGNRKFGTGTTLPAMPSNLVDPVNNPKIDPLTNRIVEDQNGDGVNDYVYDASGNLKCDPAHPCPSATQGYYEYDAENKMAKSGVGLNSYSYFYDGDGRRVKKAFGTTATVYVYNAVGQLVAEYGAQTGGEGTNYLTQDHLGSTRLVTDSDGLPKSRHDYLPFGEELLLTDVVNSGRSTNQQYKVGDIRRKFTTYERDDETGFDFAQARYYASKSGRFTTADPVFMSRDRMLNPQEINLYAYCQNNPLIYVDPDGKYFVGTDNQRVGVAFSFWGHRVMLQYSKNAPESVKRMVQLINASGSVKAMSRFLIAANNATKTHLKLSPDQRTYRDPLNSNDKPGPLFGYTQPHDKNGKPLEYSDTAKGFVGEPAYIKDENGNLAYKEVTITIYEGNLTGKGLEQFQGIFKEQGPSVTKEEAEVITGSHEIFHATDQRTINELKERDPSFNPEVPAREFHNEVHKEIINNRGRN